MTPRCYRSKPGWLIVALLVGVGCNSRPSSPVLSKVEAKPTERTVGRLTVDGATNETHSYWHDFGKVVNDQGNVKWTYKIHNGTGKALGLTNVVNRKTCCGIVRPVSQTSIPVGQSLELEVEIKASGTLGPLQHFATIETDSPDLPMLQFWSVADVVPKVRVEPIGGRDRIMKGQPLDREFQMTAADADEATPFEVTTDSAAGGTQVEWIGLARETKEPSGMRFITKRFRLKFPADREAGYYSTRISIAVDGKPATGTTAAYTVLPFLTTTPSAVVFKPGREVVTLELAAVDHKDFQILGVSSDSPGLRLRHAQPGGGAAPNVTVELADTAEKRGSVVILTDHPGQPRMVVPYFNAGK